MSIFNVFKLFIMSLNLQFFSDKIMPKLGDTVPNFTADSTIGSIDFHTWLGDSWAILFSHPADFTPVCTTELGRVQALHQEFANRGVKLIALSCDSVESHNGWINDIKASRATNIGHFIGHITCIVEIHIFTMRTVIIPI